MQPLPDDQPSFRLDGAAALVTGGGKGLGRAISLGLARWGARVAVAGRDLDACERTALDIRQSGGEAVALQLDVGDVASVDRAVAEVEHSLGGVEVLVNNAGTSSRQPTPTIEPAEFDRVMAVNVRGTFYACRAVAQGMMERRRGAIINVSSAAAALVRPGIPSTVYSASKAAVIALTRGLAEEWAPYGIRVNAVAPGFFASPLTEQARADPERLERYLRMTPLGKVGQPSELVGTVLLLASNAGSMITGQTIFVDGGRTIL